MSTELAEIGVREILTKLDNSELFGLSSTVTQGLLKNRLESREGALDAILKYSPDLISILRRKVITRDILFNYLHDQNVVVTLPILKNELIERICSYWNLPSKHITTNGSIGIGKQNELTSTSSQDHSASQHESQEHSPNAMAKKFCEWFYSLLNENDCIGSEHFWQDAILKLNLLSENKTLSKIAENAEEVVKLLHETKSEHSLFLNPNLLSHGVQGRMDLHGLVAVLCCGTLHKGDICVGVFEQIFMLARDPLSANNWKVKSTDLNLRSKGNVMAQPSLNECPLTNKLLVLQS